MKIINEAFDSSIDELKSKLKTLGETVYEDNIQLILRIGDKAHEKLFGDSSIKDSGAIQPLDEYFDEYEPISELVVFNLEFIQNLLDDGVSLEDIFFEEPDAFGSYYAIERNDGKFAWVGDRGENGLADDLQDALIYLKL